MDEDICNRPEVSVRILGVRFGFSETIWIFREIAFLIFILQSFLIPKIGNTGQ